MSNSNVCHLCRLKRLTCSVITSWKRRYLWKENFRSVFQILSSKNKDSVLSQSKWKLCAGFPKTFYDSPDKMSGEPEVLCQTFQALVGHFKHFFRCWTFCPAIWELFAGHFQNSPDMSGVSGEFPEACSVCAVGFVLIFQ